MLYALGLNHQTAPLAVRERVVFHVERLREALTELKSAFSPEAAILSTCNRTEVYLAGGERPEVGQWLARYHHLEPAELQPYLYTLPREQAVRHAFRVAAGLDSMVLGEPQILGQMKDAARAAESAGTLGTVLHKLFQRSFAVAKEVRSTTRLGAASVSMAAASVKLAARIFPSLKDQNVLFIGAGEMIELCATHFAAQAPARLTVANRTLERAERHVHHALHEQGRDHQAQEKRGDRAGGDRDAREVAPALEGAQLQHERLHLGRGRRAILRQRPAAVDELGDRRRVGRAFHLQHEQVGLDDVFGRRQDVRDHVLALHDPLVDRPVDLDRVQHAERDGGERREGDDEDAQKKSHLRAQTESLVADHAVSS